MSDGLNVIDLVLNASPAVQFVFLLLLLLSIVSWVIISMWIVLGYEWAYSLFSPKNPHSSKSKLRH